MTGLLQIQKKVALLDILKINKKLKKQWQD